MDDIRQINGYVKKGDHLERRPIFPVTKAQSVLGLGEALDGYKAHFIDPHLDNMNSRMSEMQTNIINYITNNPTNTECTMKEAIEEMASENNNMKEMIGHLINNVNDLTELNANKECSMKEAIAKMASENSDIWNMVVHLKNQKHSVEIDYDRIINGVADRVAYQTSAWWLIAPPTPEGEWGRLWINTKDNSLMYWNGQEWRPLIQGTGTAPSYNFTITTIGDPREDLGFGIQTTTQNGKVVAETTISLTALSPEFHSENNKMFSFWLSDDIGILQPFENTLTFDMPYADVNIVAVYGRHDVEPPVTVPSYLNENNFAMSIEGDNLVQRYNEPLPLKFEMVDGELIVSGPENIIQGLRIEDGQLKYTEKERWEYHASTK